MRNADIPLLAVRPGDYLFLGCDPRFDEPLATYLFCEPVPVVAIHRGGSIEERPHLLRGCLIVKASGWGEGCRRAIAIETVGEAGGPVLVMFPDDEHLVAGVNLSD